MVGHLGGEEWRERLGTVSDAKSARPCQAIWLLAKGHKVAQVAATPGFGLRYRLFLPVRPILSWLFGKLQAWRALANGSGLR